MRPSPGAHGSPVLDVHGTDVPGTLAYTAREVEVLTRSTAPEVRAQAVATEWQEDGGSAGGHRPAGVLGTLWADFRTGMESIGAGRRDTAR